MAVCATRRPPIFLVYSCFAVVGPNKAGDLTKRNPLAGLNETQKGFTLLSQAAKHNLALYSYTSDVLRFSSPFQTGLLMPMNAPYRCLISQMKPFDATQTPILTIHKQYWGFLVQHHAR